MHSIGEARIKVPDQVKRGDVITVNSIISHPMDTGFFRTAEGAPIPAYFIKDVVVTYGTRQVARFGCSSTRLPQNGHLRRSRTCSRRAAVCSYMRKSASGTSPSSVVYASD